MSALEALERKQRLAIRQVEIQQLRALGYAVSQFNGGRHLKIRGLEYWPSTGNWRNSRQNVKGELVDGDPLLDLVIREVGEAGPALARKVAQKVVNA